MRKLMRRGRIRLGMWAKLTADPWTIGFSEQPDAVSRDLEVEKIRERALTSLGEASLRIDSHEKMSFTDAPCVDVDGASETSFESLSDEMLCRILSYLPTVYSVRTSSLGQRWRNLWLQVPTLELNTNLFRDGSVFVKFMDRFLNDKKELDIKKFKLIHNYCVVVIFSSPGSRWL